jgi:hypothetical protein
MRDDRISSTAAISAVSHHNILKKFRLVLSMSFYNSACCTIISAARNARNSLHYGWMGYLLQRQNPGMGLSPVPGTVPVMLNPTIRSTAISLPA